jgi:hypothetical protein
MSDRLSSPFVAILIVALSVFLPFLTPTQSYSAVVKISWDPNTPRPSGYRVYQCLQNRSFDFTKPVWSGSQTSATLKNLQDNTSYQFVVRAYNGKVEGPASDIVTFDASTPPPSVSLPANKVALSTAAGSNGRINPSGTLIVNKYTWKTFIIKPAAGYVVADVIVDGRSIGAVSQYTFKKVTANHTISATFASKTPTASKTVLPADQVGGGGGGQAWPVPGTIEAEDYDQGREGQAYHDTTKDNRGRKYRQDGVDIWQLKNNFYVGAMANREWLHYTVDVKTTGTYSLDLQVATKQKGCMVRILADGKKLVGPVTLPNTGGPTKWATVMTTVKLNAGRRVLRLIVDRGGFNLDRIDIDPIGSNNSASK